MVEPLILSAHTINDVTQALTSGQLLHRHAHELRPSRCGSKHAATMMLIGQTVESISRHEFDYVTQHRITMSHVLILFGYQVILSHFMVTPVGSGHSPAELTRQQ